MPSNPPSSDIPDEARTLAAPNALEALRKDPVLANVRTFESFPVLGSCVLFARLGGGAQGAVYRAWHRELNIQVAVKVRMAAAGSAADRFVLEAGQGAGLTHQNLIGALDVKETDGLQYMILDYVDGEDVAARMRRKRTMDPQEALTILRDATAGIAYAHRKGVLHRDIKPANIMISKDGEVKIADLGLAKAAGATDVSLTMAGSGMGTPMFMPPEQFVEAKSVGPSADVYSLAITGWLMLAARNPFKGDSPYGIKDLVCDQGVQHLREVVPALSPSIADLIARGTERKAAKRIQDGAAFLAEVEKELAALGGPIELADPHAGASLQLGVIPPSRDVITRLSEHESVVAGGLRREHLTVPSGPRNETPVVPPRPMPAPPKGRSPAGAIAGVVLLAAAGGTGWWFTMGPGAGPESVPGATAPGAEDLDKVASSAESATSPAAADLPTDPVDGSPTGSPSGLAAGLGQPPKDPKPAIKDAGDAPKVAAGPSTPAQPAVQHKGLAQAAAYSSDWSTMFVEMALAAKAEAMKPAEFKSWADGLTGGFRKYDSWQQTRDRLNVDGQEAVAELAADPALSTALLCLTAAELIVYYDGLRYRVMDGRADYERLLGKCRFAPGAVSTEATFLLGVAALDQFLVESKGGAFPTREATDEAFRQLKIAADEGHLSAGAWLGLLYLRIDELEAATERRETVPRGWEIDPSILVEAVRKGARVGVMESHFVLARMYDLGIAAVDGPEEDRLASARTLSTDHFKSAATLGHPVAMGALMDRGESMGSAVENNLDKLESFKSQPNPETRALVEQVLALAVLTEQPGKRLAAYSRRDALEVLYRRAERPLDPGAEDLAWQDRALWLLWAKGDPSLEVGVRTRWFEEACASPWGGQVRALVMDLLLSGDDAFGTSALLVANAGSVFDGYSKPKSAEALRVTVGAAVAPGAAEFPPLLQRLVSLR